MANNQGNGRKVSVPDENRPSWRPQDETGPRYRRTSEDDERERMMRDRYRDDERFMQRDRDGTYWDDRSSRWDSDEGYRSTERYGQGQSGYGAGRYEDDRSWQSRNIGYPGSFDERARERGVDDRFAVGRGGGSWGPRGGYERSPGRRDDEGPGGYIDPQQGDEEWGNEGYSGRGGYGEQGFGGQHGWGQQRMRGPRGPGSREMVGRGSRHHVRSQVGGGGHRGKGPAGFVRSDERIREMVCEVLTDDDRIDATHIEVTVKNGDVTLAGAVDDRQQKRLAEDVVEQVAGVKDVQNLIRVGGGKAGKEVDSATGQDTRHRT